ncbi:3-deoxy-D-arabinoheptulosonate-7-phosphate synthase [Saccharothrix saharensis]|uniref:Phospho-2-dehydro-3-deoxyheptonate aldolase n=1 Tax=Saccharothrix saharensis TaxID=571190 RepID=A0A543JQZ7_9PSEU|nr:3-deoxy-7-phosphoheptulonate synthase [Saccharothrix saharensis]TQM85194.1 3-deoxy-D-arabinoheptulosonate-7-phosphate synthase [Saccharothrix saharensis]
MNIVKASTTGQQAMPDRAAEPVARTWPAVLAEQQPQWPDQDRVARVRDELGGRPGLVTAAEITTLRSLLAEVAAGRMEVLQAGDCAEDPAECTPAEVTRKIAMIDVLANVMRMTTGKPVVRVGRIAGQFAKPRSRPVEVVDGVELPVYRGHMVNGPGPDALSRRADPERLLTGYVAAAAATEVIRRHNAGDRPVAEPPLWTSHEALLLDYEVPMMRWDQRLGRYLASTHWPWVGERTRQVDGAHVDLLSTVANPVACKVGPRMSPAELLDLCERLDPDREPGRLTLIARMGAGRVDAVTRLAAAVRAAGHPVIWLCDPMHGNTVELRDGRKTRFIVTIAAEVRDFHAAVRAAGAVAGGLHLETTPHQVLECVPDKEAGRNVARRYTSLCDPRLNLEQAVAVVAQWAR